MIFALFLVIFFCSRDFCPADADWVNFINDWKIKDKFFDFDKIYFEYLHNFVIFTVQQSNGKKHNSICK